METIKEWFEDPTMLTFYVSCAALGGIVLVLQFVLTLFGGDGDGDVDGFDDVDGDAAFSVLSVRAMAAFVTFFGLTGWGGTNAGWSTPTIILVALGAGLLVMLLVSWIVMLQRRLQSAGNVDPENAVGKPARVYLRIPGGQSGVGKITVSIQGRSEEYTAMTSGESLPTGSEVRVVRMTTPGTFEVERLV